MKKIISLLIALGCILALFSCGDSPIDGFAKIVSSSEPTKIITQTSYNDGENTLTGRFETQIYGSDFMMKYDYQFYPEPSAGLNPGNFIDSKSGVIYYNKGLYSTDEGVTWGTGVPGETAMQLKLNLDFDKVKEHNISKDEKTLTMIVLAENTEAVLGRKISADQNGVTIEIEHDGKSLRKISLSYTTESEAQVYSETSYSYDKVTSPFVEEVVTQ